MEADRAGNIRSLFAADPWVVSGGLRIAPICPWIIWLHSPPG
jgi:hypothetical protein